MKTWHALLGTSVLTTLLGSGCIIVGSDDSGDDGTSGADDAADDAADDTAGDPGPSATSAPTGTDAEACAAECTAATSCDEAPEADCVATCELGIANLRAALGDACGDDLVASFECTSALGCEARATYPNDCSEPAPGLMSEACAVDSCAGWCAHEEACDPDPFPGVCAEICEGMAQQAIMGDATCAAKLDAYFACMTDAECGVDDAEACPEQTAAAEDCMGVIVVSTD